MVNILEMKVDDLKEKYKDVDRLTAIFQIQKDLNYLFREKEKDLGIDTKEKQIEIRKVAFYLIEELVEAVNLLKNREWMETELPVDRNHLYDELADLFHTMIRFLLMLDIDADLLFDIYLRKCKVNKFRLRSGY